MLVCFLPYNNTTFVGNFYSILPWYVLIQQICKLFAILLQENSPIVVFYKFLILLLRKWEYIICYCCCITKKVLSLTFHHKSFNPRRPHTIPARQTSSRIHTIFNVERCFWAQNIFHPYSVFKITSKKPWIRRQLQLDGWSCNDSHCRRSSSYLHHKLNEKR